MKLTDIVVLEAAPLGDEPVELKDVVKYFPTQHKKAIKTFMKTGRLVFGGQQVFDAGGDNGEGLDEALQHAKKLLDHEFVEITVHMNAAGTKLQGDDDYTHFEYEAHIQEKTETWIGYDTKANHLLLGFDCWIDEEDFNQEWDEKFEQCFGEEFDMDNEEHEKVFNRAWKEYNSSVLFGAVVQVTENMHAEMEMPIMEGGFYRGPYKNLNQDHILALV
jgi:hypothetical protein